MLIILSLFILLAMGLQSHAQRVVILEDLREGPEDPDFGMNRRHYRHSFLRLHFVAGPPDATGAEVIYGRSRSLEYGYRYKRKFSEVFSAGAELSFRRTAFHMEQDEGKTVPDTVLYDRQKLVFLNVGGGLYKRINVGQRGDYIGRFLDLGAYGGWNFHTRHVSHFENDLDERVRVRRSGLDYPAPFEYGVMARVGLNNFVLKGTWRISDLFKSSAELSELPRLSIGLEVGLHPF